MLPFVHAAACTRYAPAAVTSGTHRAHLTVSCPLPATCRFFGVDNVRQAVRRINKMAQRELQARGRLGSGLRGMLERVVGLAGMLHQSGLLLPMLMHPACSCVHSLPCSWQPA